MPCQPPFDPSVSVRAALAAVAPPRRRDRLRRRPERLRRRRERERERRPRSRSWRRGLENKQVVFKAKLRLTFWYEKYI